MGFKNKEKMQEIAYTAGYIFGATIVVCAMAIAVVGSCKVIVWLLTI